MNLRQYRLDTFLVIAFILLLPFSPGWATALAGIWWTRRPVKVKRTYLAIGVFILLIALIWNRLNYIF